MNANNGNNLIAIKTYHNGNYHLAIINHDQEIVKQISANCIIGADESVICIRDSNVNNDIKVIDRSLETVDTIRFLNGLPEFSLEMSNFQR